MNSLVPILMIAVGGTLWLTGMFLLLGKICTGAIHETDDFIKQGKIFFTRMFLVFTFEIRENLLSVVTFVGGMVLLILNPAVEF